MLDTEFLSEVDLKRTNNIRERERIEKECPCANCGEN